jgi:cytochrome c-type biogenesis protein CcmH/NrfG
MPLLGSTGFLSRNIYKTGAKIVANGAEREVQKAWTPTQAYVMAGICLLVGVALGYLFRGSESGSAVPARTAQSAPMAPDAAGPQQQMPSPDDLKRMADVQAAPLMEKLKSDPNNPGLLASIGNYYYDAQQYPIAIKYYQQSLQLQPANTSVRTDLATAFWYAGDADTAISEFKKSLSYEPTKPNTLFNLGIVEWQGKMDANAAVATWQKLLDTNPGYAAKDKVLQLMAQAKKHQGLKPGTPAGPLPQ